MTRPYGPGVASGPPAVPQAPAGGPDPAAAARLRLVVARLYRQLAQASGIDRDLTYAQLSALARTQEHGPLRIGELAAYEQVAMPSLTRTMAPLAEAGLIRKEPDPADRRSWRVSITDEGAALLGRIRRQHSELLVRRMARLTPEQTATLLEALPVLELLLTEPEAEADRAVGEDQADQRDQADQGDRVDQADGADRADRSGQS